MSITFILDAVLFGFGFYGLATLLGYGFMSEPQRQTSRQLNGAATLLVRVVGILYLLFIAVSWIPWLLAPMNISVVEPQWKRLLGPSGFFVLYEPITLLAFTQLFWIKALRQSLWVTAIFGLILMFDPEKWVILLTSIHRDFFPSSQGYPHQIPAWMIREALLKLYLFLLILTLTTLARLRLKMQRETTG